MNFIKRAWLNLTAKKGRSALLVLVTSAIMLFVLAGILIRGAANTATENAKDSVGATLTLSADRAAAFKKMRAGTTGGTKPSLSMSPVKISTAKKIAALKNVESYSATVSTSANASGFDAIETSSDSSGFGGKMPGASSGDITISGVTSTASNSSFSDGTYSIKSGRGLTSKDLGTKNVVIESELATENSLKVGDSIKLKSTTGDKDTYTVKIVGIYKAKSSSSTSMGPGQSDPSNTIFTAYTLANTFKGSKYAGTADSVIFTVSKPAQVASVKKAAKKLITSKFTLTADDATYQTVKSSMKTVTGFANKIVWLVAIAGTIILALIVILMIRERRFEIGVLLSLGEKRGKIIAQFFTELLVILVIGVGVAGVGGKFVGDKLGQQLITSTQTATTTTSSQGGMQGGPGSGNGGMQGGRPSGTPGGGFKQAAAEQTKQAKLTTKVTVKDMGILLGLGLIIILVAILAGAGGILRLQPKKVLIG